MKDLVAYALPVIGFLVGWLAFHSGRFISDRGHVLFDLPDQNTKNFSICNIQDNFWKGLLKYFGLSQAHREHFKTSTVYGFIFSVVPFLFDDKIQQIIIFGFCIILVWTTIFDWRHSVVPDLYVFVICVLALVKIVIFRHNIWNHVLASVISALLMSGLLAVSALFHARRNARQNAGDVGEGTQVRLSELAWGDVTLISGLGLAVGIWALPVFWFLAGAFHILAHVMTSRGRRATRLGEPVPMAPSICLSAFCTICLFNSSVGKTATGHILVIPS